jgi:hypothetical protein
MEDMGSLRQAGFELSGFEPELGQDQRRDWLRTGSRVTETGVTKKRLLFPKLKDINK